MFQCVIPSISSNVILFHRRRKKAGRKNGKIKGEKQPGSKAKRQKTTPAARNRQKKDCNMQSWERAKPLSPSEVSPDGTGRGTCMENSGWRAPLGYLMWQNISRQVFSLTLYYAS